MSDDMTTTQIVNHIVETLTESVTQLILLVIPLQESGGEMPPKLPQGAQGVCKAAKVLGEAACGLAEDEYDDFPSIKTQIENAAGSVNKAANGLSEAVKRIEKSGNRITGWDQLVDACQIISGKTILLLQIVYGAQLQKIFLAGDRALKALNLDSERAKTDAEALASDVSNAAQQAAQVAQYLREKAEDTDAPLEKKRLEEAAEDLDEKAAALIDKVNTLFSDPDDKNAARAFQDSVQDVKNAIKYSQDVLQNDLQDAEDKIKQSQEQLSDPGAMYPSLPRAPTRDVEDEKDLAKARSIPTAVERVAHAAEPDDPVSLKAALDDLTNLENELGNDIRALADESRDIQQKKALLKHLDDLETLLPQQRDAAEKYNKTNNPSDKNNLDRLDDLIGDAIHDLEDAIHPGAGLVDDVSEAKRRVEQVENNALNNPHDLDESIKKENDFFEKLNNKLNPMVSRSNPEDKLTLQEALEDIDSLLPKQQTLAQRVRSNPRDNISQRDLDDTTDRINGALDKIASVVDPSIDRDITVTAREAREACNDMDDAARDGDRAKLNNAAKRARDAERRLADQARVKAEQVYNPLDKDQLDKGANDLDNIVPVQFGAADKILKLPHDKESQNKLNDINDRIRDTITKIEAVDNPTAHVLNAAEKAQRAVDQLNKESKAGDPKNTKKALDKANTALEDLVDATNEYKDDLRNADRRRAVDAALSSLEREIPDEISSAQKTISNPGDKKAQGRLNEATERVQDAIGEVKAAVGPQHKDRVHNAADNLEKKIEALDKARQQGLSDLPLASKMVGDANKELHDSVLSAAHNPRDHRKQNEMLEALKELDSVLPAHFDNVREAAVDSSKIKKAKKSEDDVRNAVDKIRDAVADSPQDKLASKARQLVYDADKLQKYSKKEETLPNAAVKAKSIAKRAPEFRNEVKAYASSTADKDKKDRLNDAADHVMVLVPPYLDSFSKVAHDPNDNTKQRRLDDLHDKLVTALNRAAEELDPIDPLTSFLAADKQRQQALLDLERARKAGDKDAANKALDDLERALRQMRDAAATEQDPERAKAIKDAIQALDDLLLSLRSTGEDAIANPKDKERQKALDDLLLNLDDIIKKLTPKDKQQQVRLEDADVLRRDLDALQAAAVRKDLKDMANASRDISRDGPKVAEQARIQANKMDDPDRADRIRNAANTIDALTPATIAASRDVAKDPNDHGRQRNLDEHIAALRKAVDSAEGRKSDERNLSLDLSPEDSKTYDETAKTLVEAKKELDDLINRLLSNPDDKGAQNNLDELFMRMKDPTDKFAMLLEPTRQEAVDDLAEKQIDALSHLRDAAIDRDLNGFREGAKSIAKDHDNMKKLMEPFIQQSLKDDDKEKHKRLTDCLNTIDELLPMAIKAGTGVLKDPSDKNSQKDLGDAVDRIQDLYRDLVDDVYPLGEEGIDTLAQQIKDKSDDLINDVKNADKAKGGNDNRELQQLVDDLLNVARPVAYAQLHSDPESHKILSDDIKRIEEIKKEIPAAANDALDMPGDKKSQDNLEELVKQLQDLVNKLKDDAKTNPLVAIKQEERALDDIVFASGRGEPKDIATNTKKLADKNNIVNNICKAESEKIDDPIRRKQVIDSLNELNELLPKEIRAVQGTIKSLSTNPDDKNAQDRVTAVSDEMRAPLARISAAIQPTPDKRVIAGVDDLLADVARTKLAAMDGKPDEIDDNVSKAKEKIVLIRDATKDTGIDKHSPIDDMLRKIEEALNKVPIIATSAANNPSDKNKQAELDNILNDIRIPAKAIKDIVGETSNSPFSATKKAQRILAGINAAKKRGGRGYDMLIAAQDLADCMNGMVGEVVPTAISASGGSLDIDSLLSDLDGLARGAPSLSKSSSTPLGDEISKIDEVMKSRPAPEVGTLAHKLETSRQEKIEKPLKEMKKDVFEYAHLSNINDAMKALIEAARTGNRRGFLLCARQLANFINALTAELKTKANTVKDPVLKDRLLRDLSSLKDFSIQLKILASVRASASGASPDTDKQLSMLADNMGNLLNRTMNTCSIIRIKNKSF